MLQSPPSPSADEIASAPPDVLTLMLFEGAVRFGRRARHAIDTGEVAEGAELVGRVRAIVRELDSSLDHSVDDADDAGGVSGHLAAIYDYLLRRLAVAVEEAEALDEVVADLGELAVTWGTLVAGRRAEAEVASERAAVGA